MILADTSVWIHHLRSDFPELRSALEDGLVLVHPFVIGELACGTLKNRREFLQDLAQLPTIVVAEHAEVMALVDRWGLAGSGIGWLDAHLLAAARIAGARVWTLDQPLARAAAVIGA